MPLLEDGRLVEDRWTRVGDDEPLPDEGPVLVSTQRLAAEADVLIARPAPWGLALRNDDRLDDLAAHLPAISLVVLHFPTFRDGRAYSQARLLRERFGYRGRLRATGDVQRDQAQFLVRVGFDSFELARAEEVAPFVKAAAAVSVAYQPTGSAPATALDRRVKDIDAQDDASGKSATPAQAATPFWDAYIYAF